MESIKLCRHEKISKDNGLVKFNSRLDSEMINQHCVFFYYFYKRKTALKAGNHDAAIGLGLLTEEGEYEFAEEPPLDEEPCEVFTVEPEEMS